MEKIIRFIIKLIDLILNILNHKKLVKLTNECKLKFQYFHEIEIFDKDDVDGFSAMLYIKPIFYKYQIHKFECKYYNNKLYLCIELDSPGVLIGKGGSNIDKIKKYLNIDIHVEESKLWKVKY